MEEKRKNSVSSEKEQSKYNLEWFQEEEVRKGQEHQVDLIPYAKEGFDWTQLREIRLGLEKKLDVEPYAKKHYVSYQMRQIRKGLEAGINTKFYSDAEYDWFQMEEIRLGLEDKIDVTIYANKQYEYFCMRQIRKGLLIGINLIPYREKGYSNRVLREIRRAKKKNVDISRYVEEGYGYEQLEQIRTALENYNDLMPYVDKNTSGSQMREIRLGLEKNIDVASYKASEYNWAQMREIRLGLEKKIDVSWYANHYYSKAQMKEIRLGLEAGINVAPYAKLMLGAKDMRISREWILQNGELEQPGKIAEAAEEVPLHCKEHLITVDPEEMCAYLELAETEEDITMDGILQLLAECGVKMGIRKDFIQNAIDLKQYYKKVLVAEGKKAVDGEDGEYEFFFRTKMPKIPKLMNDGSVDYKNVDFFEQVKEGQKIAYYKRATGGEFGYTVTGVLQKPQKGKDLPLLRGKGFTKQEDEVTYTADYDGRIEIDEYNITISKIYVYNGDVTNSIGNIRFNGDIEINGSVGSGVNIEAAGDVVISGNVESAVIIAGKEIMVQGGVNAPGSAYLEAGTSISGKFFENVMLKAKDEIKANYLLNCQVQTMGKVIVSGKRGSIVGGVISAVEGITAYTLGNSAELRTVLDIGMNDVFARQYSYLEQEASKRQSEIQIFQEGIKKYEKSYKQEELLNLTIYTKMKQAIMEKQEELKKLKKQQADMFRNTSRSDVIQVRAMGKVHPGCIIRINKMNMVVREGAEMVLFRLEDNKVAAFSCKG